MEQQTAEQRFAALGLELPPAPSPLGVYKPFLIVDNLVYVSGHGPVKTDRSLIKGRIGKELNQDEGKEAARQVGLTILATLKANLESLDQIKRVIKVLGMVNCVPEFEKHPYIINGCSELFASVWGDDGIGVRSEALALAPGSVATRAEYRLQVVPACLVGGDHRDRGIRGHPAASSIVASQAQAVG